MKMPTELEVPVDAGKCEDCADRDEDCPGVEDKVACWLYDPGRGMCPYLRASSIRSQSQ